MAIWHDFEKDAAKYFERSHQVFDSSRKADSGYKRDSHAVSYSSELKFAYGRVGLGLG